MVCPQSSLFYFLLWLIFFKHTRYGNVECKSSYRAHHLCPWPPFPPSPNLIKWHLKGSMKIFLQSNNLMVSSLCWSMQCQIYANLEASDSIWSDKNFFKSHNTHLMGPWQVNTHLAKGNFLFLEKQKIEFLKKRPQTLQFCLSHPLAFHSFISHA